MEDILTTKEEIFAEHLYSVKSTDIEAIKEQIVIVREKKGKLSRLMMEKLGTPEWMPLFEIHSKYTTCVVILERRMQSGCRLFGLNYREEMRSIFHVSSYEKKT